MDNISENIEAILFVSGEGISTETLCLQLGISSEEMRDALNVLEQKYANESGIKLIKFDNKIQFATNPAYSENIAMVLNPIKEKALTKATLETLSIIAYKQPITRLEIEQIRGVNCDYAIQMLMNHNLIDVIGRKDAVGKPLLFGTTETFLKRFNLHSLNDLPDNESILERIKVIHQVDNNLYNYDLKHEEELIEDDVPQFLKDENINIVESDE